MADAAALVVVAPEVPAGDGAFVAVLPAEDEFGDAPRAEHVPPGCFNVAAFLCMRGKQWKAERECRRQVRLERSVGLLHVAASESAGRIVYLYSLFFCTWI